MENPTFEKVKRSFEDIRDVCRQVWFKYYNGVQVGVEINKYVRNHDEYSHIIIATDDIIFSKAKFINHLKEAVNYPVLSACCNVNKGSWGKCLDCEDPDKTHKYLNVTFNPVKMPITSQQCYDHVTLEWAKRFGSIAPVYWQGNVLTIMKRKLFLLMGGLKHGYTPGGGLPTDIGLAQELRNLRVEQYVDFRFRCGHICTKLEHIEKNLDSFIMEASHQYQP